MPRAESKKTAQAATLPSRLRIVGGRWRGMRIDFPPIEAIRPTPDRVRETLFNWLQQHILGAACLDLFAGSGALGIEALSRGALHVTFVDREPRIVKHLNATLARLQAMNAEVVTSDALLYLKGPPRRFDTVFLDPPFASDVLPQVFTLLARGWLAPVAHIYVECSARSPLPALPPGWSLHRSKRAGEVGYHLLQAVTEAVEDAS
jgi:16S rRNA (guanine966-N2)-methyltransferase